MNGWKKINFWISSRLHKINFLKILIHRNPTSILAPWVQFPFSQPVKKLFWKVCVWVWVQLVTLEASFQFCRAYYSETFWKAIKRCGWPRIKAEKAREGKASNEWGLEIWWGFGQRFTSNEEIGWRLSHVFRRLFFSFFPESSGRLWNLTH